MGFYFGLTFVFLRFSMIHETITTLTHINLYLALLTGTVSIVLTLASGAVPRTCQNLGGKFWMGFLILLAMAIPFSTWRGESIVVFMSYIRGDLPVLFILGGMVLTWREFSMVLSALAISAVSTLSMERVFANMDEARLSFGSGTIGNSNDYAAHIIILLPFLLWIVFSNKAKILKIFSVTILIFGLYILLKTGSRGGLVGLIAGFAIVLLRGPGKLRWILGLSLPIVFVLLIGVLPPSVLVRYSGILGSAATVDGTKDTTGTSGSTEARKDLLKKSLQYTLEHPVFGVGPGAFSMYEGSLATANGVHGHWQETHNSYTEISSEDGIPAVICFLGAIVCAFVSVNKSIALARKMKLNMHAAAAFCCLLSLTMMCMTMTFLTLGYRFYLPAVCGLIIGLERILRLQIVPGEVLKATGGDGRNQRPLSPLHFARQSVYPMKRKMAR